MRNFLYENCIYELPNGLGIASYESLGQQRVALIFSRGSKSYLVEEQVVEDIIEEVENLFIERLNKL